MFPNLNGTLLSIDDRRIDPFNPSCFSNGTLLRYDGVTLSPKSSLTILAGSLKSNQTYQFQISIESRQNSSIKTTGYLLVKIEDTYSQMIIIG